MLTRRGLRGSAAFVHLVGTPSCQTGLSWFFPNYDFVGKGRLMPAMGRRLASKLL